MNIPSSQQPNSQRTQSQDLLQIPIFHLKIGQEQHKYKKKSQSSEKNLTSQQKLDVQNKIQKLNSMNFNFSGQKAQKKEVPSVKYAHLTVEIKNKKNKSTTQSAGQKSKREFETQTVQSRENLNSTQQQTQQTQQFTQQTEVQTQQQQFQNQQFPQTAVNNSKNGSKSSRENLKIVQINRDFSSSNQEQNVDNNKDNEEDNQKDIFNTDLNNFYSNRQKEINQAKRQQQQQQQFEQQLQQEQVRPILKNSKSKDNTQTDFQSSESPSINKQTLKDLIKTTSAIVDNQKNIDLNEIGLRQKKAQLLDQLYKDSNIQNEQFDQPQYEQLMKNESQQEDINSQLYSKSVEQNQPPKRAYNFPKLRSFEAPQQENFAQQQDLQAPEQNFDQEVDIDSQLYSKSLEQNQPPTPAYNFPKLQEPEQQNFDQQLNLQTQVHQEQPKSQHRQWKNSYQQQSSANEQDVKQQLKQEELTQQQQEYSENQQDYQDQQEYTENQQYQEDQYDQQEQQDQYDQQDQQDQQEQQEQQYDLQDQQGSSSKNSEENIMRLSQKYVNELTEKLSPNQKEVQFDDNNEENDDSLNSSQISAEFKKIQMDKNQNLTNEIQENQSFKETTEKEDLQNLKIQKDTGNWSNYLKRPQEQEEIKYSFGQYQVEPRNTQIKSYGQVYDQYYQTQIQNDSANKINKDLHAITSNTKLQQDLLKDEQKNQAVYTKYDYLHEPKIYNFVDHQQSSRQFQFTNTVESKKMQAQNQVEVERSFQVQSSKDHKNIEDHVVEPIDQHLDNEYVKYQKQKEEEYKIKQDDIDYHLDLQYNQYKQEILDANNQKVQKARKAELEAENLKVQQELSIKKRQQEKHESNVTQFNLEIENYENPVLGLIEKNDQDFGIDFQQKRSLTIQKLQNKYSEREFQNENLSQSQKNDISLNINDRNLISTIEERLSIRQKEIENDYNSNKKNRQSSRKSAQSTQKSGEKQSARKDRSFEGQSVNYQSMVNTTPAKGLNKSILKNSKAKLLQSNEQILNKSNSKRVNESVQFDTTNAFSIITKNREGKEELGSEIGQNHHKIFNTSAHDIKNASFVRGQNMNLKENSSVTLAVINNSSYMCNGGKEKLQRVIDQEEEDEQQENTFDIEAQLKELYTQEKAYLQNPRQQNQKSQQLYVKLTWEIANLLYKLKNKKECISYCEKGLKTVESLKLRQVSGQYQYYQLRLLQLEGENYYSEGQFRQAVKCFKCSIDQENLFTEKMKMSEEFLEAASQNSYYSYALSLQRNKQYKEALQYYKLSEILYNKPSFREKYILTLVRISEVAIKLYNETLTEQYTQKAIDTIENQKVLYTKYQNTLAQLHEQLGYLYNDQQNYEQALQSYDSALKTKKSFENNNHIKCIPLEFAMGKILVSLQRYSDAEDVFLNINKVIERNPGQCMLYLGKSYVNLAEIQSHLQFPQDALFYYESAFDLYKDQLGLNHINSYKAIVNIIRICLDLDLDTKACQFREILVDQINTNTDFQSIIFISDLGTIYKDRQRLSEAVQLYENSIELYKTFDMSVQPKKRAVYLPNIYINLAICNMQMEQYENSIRNYKYAAELNIKLNGQMDNLNSYIYQGLAMVYDQLKRKDEALQYRKKADKITQSNI